MIDMSIEPALTLLAPAAVVEGSAPPAVQWQWFVCGKILLWRGGEGREGGRERREHSSSDKYRTRPLFPYVHITKSARAHSGASFTSGHVNYAQWI